jgi:hypothetical protein
MRNLHIYFTLKTEIPNSQFSPNYISDGTVMCYIIVVYQKMRLIFVIVIGVLGSDLVQIL